MLQDIDLVYDRTGALVTSAPVKAPAFIAGGVALSTPSEAQPSDHGLIAWSSDPNYASTTTTATNGTLYLAAVWLRSAATVSKVWWIQAGTVGAGATAGQNWAGLYNASGTLLASTGIDAQITTATAQSATITSQALSAGRYWVALLFNATTPPTLARSFGTSATANNLGLTAANYRYCTNGTGLTTMPASITPASNSLTGSSALTVAVS